jgi:hypothetical protein
MKKNFTQIVFTLSAMVILYASCTKNNLKPVAATAVDYKALSSTIAITFYKSITGANGGVDVSQGIKSPFKPSSTGRGLRLNDVVSLCGFAIDTTYGVTIPPPSPMPTPDTIKHSYGKFNFVYTCDAGVVNGYNVTDSVAYTTSYFNYATNNLLGQRYVVKALDQTYKVVSMNGSIFSSVGQFKTLSETGSYIQATYTLTGLKVDFTTGIADVVSGTATFDMIVDPTASVALPANRKEYTGTITYLGNHKAKLTINPGQVFTVDLITGVATPA